MPSLRTFTTCTSPVGRRAARRPARPPPRSSRRRRACSSSAGFASRLGSAYSSSSSALDLGDLAARDGPGLLLGDDLVVRVEVAQVVRRHRAEPAQQLGRQLDGVGELVAVLGEQLGQQVHAVDADRALPGQVVEPDVVERDRLRRDTRAWPANRRWKPMATLHSPTARCPASSSARVTMPTGLVKSTIQASGRGAARTRSAMSSTTGTVRSALASPPAPVVSCPTQPHSSGNGLVRVAGGLAADPQLEQHGVGAVDAGVEVGGGGAPRPGCPRVAEDPAREAADELQPLGVRVDQHELVDASSGVAQPGEPVDQLRGVRRPAADDGELHPLTPVKCEPSTKAFWARKKSTTTGSHDQQGRGHGQVPVDVVQRPGTTRGPSDRVQLVRVLAGVEQRAEVVVPGSRRTGTAPTAAMPGRAIGSTTRSSVRNSPQPSTRAASRYSCGIVSRNCRSRKMRERVAEQASAGSAATACR